MVRGEVGRHLGAEGDGLAVAGLVEHERRIAPAQVRVDVVAALHAHPAAVRQSEERRALRPPLIDPGRWESGEKEVARGLGEGGVAWAAHVARAELERGLVERDGLVADVHLGMCRAVSCLIV